MLQTYLLRNDVIIHMLTWQNCLLAALLVSWIFSSRENENIKIKEFFHKVIIFVQSVLFMLYSKDSKGIGPKYNPDPQYVLSRNDVNKKTVVFIRHGESDWNLVFNKGINLSFPFRLFNAIKDEFLLLFQLDSVFLDSPLNK